MRLNDSNDRASTRTTQQSCSRTRISVSRLIHDLVLSFSDQFSNSNITVELDVQPLDALADISLIHEALQSMVQTALQSMPDGGELSVTLIDSSHQWELEVADTSNNRFVEAAINKQAQPDFPRDETPDELPNIFSLDAFHTDDTLRPVHAAADAHGGHVQVWDCPSGGTANVLVIPKRHHNAA